MWKKCCLFLITDVLWIHVHVYAGEEGRVYVADDEGRRGGRKGEVGEEGIRGSRGGEVGERESVCRGGEEGRVYVAKGEGRGGGGRRAGGVVIREGEHMSRRGIREGEHI